MALELYLAHRTRGNNSHIFGAYTLKNGKWFDTIKPLIEVFYSANTLGFAIAACDGPIKRELGGNYLLVYDLPACFTEQRANRSAYLPLTALQREHVVRGMADARRNMDGQAADVGGLILRL